MIVKDQIGSAADPVPGHGDRRQALVLDPGARPMPMGFADYLRVIRRRLSYLVPVSLAVSLIGIGVALYLPAVYRATGTIAVESQQISSDLVRSTETGSADARIGFLQQLVMNDVKLEEIIDQFNLYPKQRTSQPMAKLVTRLRGDIEVQAVQDKFSPGHVTIAFTVSFEHTDPETARAVAANLVELFLAENTRRRNARATDTTEFLRREANRLSSQARAMDSKVAAFKQEHSNALPEHLSLRISMLESAESDLRGIQRDLAASEQEKRFLETQRETYSAFTPLPTRTPSAATPPEQQLRELQSRLQSYQGAYTEAYPDVITLKRRIAALEARIPSHSGQARAGAAPSDPGLAEIQSRIDSAEARLTSLRFQEKGLRSKITELQGQILETPKVELGLRDLAFGYQSAQKEYEDVRSKQQQAELAESLESQKMAERLLLLEVPTRPIVPARPNRLKLIGLALLAALGSGIGAAFAADALDPRVRDPSMLNALLGLGSLVVIPNIEHAAERRRRLRRTWLTRVALVSVLPIALALLHFLGLPLAELVRRVHP